MGGAERDLLRRLPHLAKWYDVSVATLSSCQELESICREHNIKLFKSSTYWKPPTSAFSQISDKVHRSSKKAWLSCQDLMNKLPSFDYFHIISGDGHLAIIELLPPTKKSHLYLLEPHRGYHEDSLHRNLYGKLRRPKIITNLFLSKGRKNDLKIIRDFSKKPNTLVSGNSSYTANRIKEVYGFECDYLHPCVDKKEYSKEIKNLENPYNNSKDMNYVVTIGTANWAKGSMETISMLENTNLSLVHVGGGPKEELKILQQHAKLNNVELWIAPRLSSEELSVLIQQSLAVVSMAHKEPFGLTPIEAFSIGTPALFVDDGGFRDSIIDGKCGRLIPRTDYSEWHIALKQSKNQQIRDEWAEFGRKRIEELKLSPLQQAEKLHKLLQS